ncbi:MAG: xanthine dehydrogenase family protein molybdopterin-binding subunit [Rhodospirillales bacterium]|jgi:carbon-monoxide dehydrogenase large subunit|nr:carbon monoxide dehydrogenase [Rhodospirillaceae bacterium]MAF47522.1 carbon monoxide dehydrogenase [Rhodospirillaceae bacterium]MDP6427091.1 xanthine dehydrogenase family protein molybdopterin-binding subunit [Rhodospirillales bacterium]MDP6643445.1 xanthine dehydrogenase family protein molybdopterin-binding subunit [Rhodospirillales bacterium]MDP6840779.1 xanthine dehydrogenase family protein molybdopterin-binding subunit [Rhodospirillales bacterium]|tara:strand:- start:629 stop:2983 length:2355 start_codon:yes stop_codon:yes gene_type:complete
MSETGIGAAVRRKEDSRFLTGKGNYTDDINRPGQTYAYFLRSAVAHAEIKGIDVSAAAKADGVVAVFTGADMEGIGGLPCGWGLTFQNGDPMVEPAHPVLAQGKVRHVGDPVAIVIAESKKQAKAAAQLIKLDLDELPAVVNMVKAAEGGTLVHDEAANNICYDWAIGEKDVVDEAFSKADHVTTIDIVNNRLIPNAIEPRVAIGEFEATSGDYTLYTTTQNPHVIRLLMGAFVLQIPEHKLRIVAPDVGGGFGSKIFHYAEEAAVTWASAQINRPIKWTAERSESFISDAHGRDHVSHAELALDKDGKFLGLRVETYANMGAYLSTFAPAVPTYLHATLLAGTYTTPVIYCNIKAMFTNTVPVDAYRGAGRPEASYILERLVDRAAREMGIDQVEIRRQNFIQPDQFPYQTPVALAYDSGDYNATLDTALKNADVKGFDKRKAASKKDGKLRGIGYSTYIEACGVAPSAVAGALGARAGLYESAVVRVHPTGSVSLFTGTHSHGQGHETTFAQLVSDQLGIDFESVDVVHGDTSKIQFGMGTYGSRSLAVGGEAIVRATNKIIDKGRKIAAHVLEASEGDIEFKDGAFTVSGTDKSMAFGEVALTAYVPHNFPHDTLEPGLEESAFYDPLNFTFPGGCHICEVEVDPATGSVEVAAFTAVDDVGRVINPMIVEGQVHGGVTQGIGQALLEGCVYDDNGQLLTGSYLDYTMPRADNLPSYNVGTEETLCAHNSLGVKGVGEVGAIGSPPAVINAVVDALSELGVTDVPMPATSQAVWRAIQAAS